MSQKIIDEVERCWLYALDKFRLKDFDYLSDELKICNTIAGKFLYGHPLEIIAEIKTDIEDRERMYDIFPLCALYTDIPVRKHQYGDYDGTTLQIIIAMPTVDTYNTPMRVLKNFDPYLRPLLRHFMKALTDSNVFSIVDETQDIKATIYERFLWGKTGLYGNTGNIFNNFMDAIQIENLELKLNVNDC